MNIEEENQLRKAFTQKAIPFLVPFEKDRKNVLIKAAIIGIAGTIIGVALLIFMPTEMKHTDDSNIPFAIIVGGFVWGYHIVKSFFNKIKAAIYPIIFKPFNIEYSRPEEISKLNLENLLTKSTVLNGFDSVCIDDVFSGNHQGLTFAMMEADITRGHGKHRNTIFEGIIFVADSNKKFKSITIIKNDLGILSNSINFSNTIKSVKLEDVEFEKKFEVYGEDQVESRYLLTPSFMNRLLDYSTKKNRSIQVAFIDNKILLLVPITGDSFEIPMFSTILRIEPFIDVIEEVYELLEIINALKLEQNIGL